MLLPYHYGLIGHSEGMPHTYTCGAGHMRWTYMHGRAITYRELSNVQHCVLGNLVTFSLAVARVQS